MDLKILGKLDEGERDVRAGCPRSPFPRHATGPYRRFQEKGGTLYAIGRLEGALSDGRAVNKQVWLPVEGASASGDEGEAGGFARPAVPTPGACSILTLDLGPLDLNLLGLRVFLDEVNLLIEAIPGAGNLVGNLLCAVAGLLDPGGILGGVRSPAC